MGLGRPLAIATLSNTCPSDRKFLRLGGEKTEVKKINARKTATRDADLSDCFYFPRRFDVQSPNNFIVSEKTHRGNIKPEWW
jgi:hypothetical protein